MKKIKSIDDLKKDDLNFNKGTIEGHKYLQKSLEDFGALRSIVVDKDGNVIAGNKTLENYQKIGKKEVEIVETEGDKLVVVKRNDLDLNSNKGRQAAFADNYTSQIGLEWDYQNIIDILPKEDLQEWEFEPPSIDAEIIDDDGLTIDEVDVIDDEENIDTKDINDFDDIEDKPKPDTVTLSTPFKTNFYDELITNIKKIDNNIAKAFVILAEYFETNFDLENDAEMEERLNNIKIISADMENDEQREKVAKIFLKLSKLSSKEEKDRAISGIGAGILTAVRVYHHDKSK